MNPFGVVAALTLSLSGAGIISRERLPWDNHLTLAGVAVLGFVGSLALSYGFEGAIVFLSYLSGGLAGFAGYCAILSFRGFRGDNR